MQALRVLGRVRLSRSSDESTSIERQREIIEQWSNANGHNVVGWAEDLDVSGSVDPFETPGLGDWLNHRTPEFDVICAWKLDRLGRNAIQLNKLFGWCQDHDKTIVSCSESIDLGSWAGRMLASVIAGLAEGELEAIRERTRSSRQKLRESARWAGGKPPYGYRKARHPDGVGWVLEIDPEPHEVVTGIVDDVLSGKPLRQICLRLNAERYRTPAQYNATVKLNAPQVRWPGGQTPVGSWQVPALANLLRSKALRGYQHYKGEAVRGDDGMPLQLAEPLVSSDRWERMQAALDANKPRFSGEAKLSQLSGLVSCAVCGTTLLHSRMTTGGRLYRYYRCGNRDSAQIPADDLEQMAGETFLQELGDTEVHERIWVPGDSQETALREAVTAYDELTEAAGRAVSATAKQRLQRQLAALDAQILELESAPKREARWEYRPTGGTYGQLWESADDDGKRELLQKSGITMTAAITGVVRRTKYNAGAYHFNINIPDGLRGRML